MVDIIDMNASEGVPVFPIRMAMIVGVRIHRKQNKFKCPKCKAEMDITDDLEQRRNMLDLQD